MSELVEIDGSLLEGGGQILRVSITLSALKKVPVRIINIRGGRNKPGLMEQHLKGIELVRDMCDAKVKGAEIGSTEVEFWPNELKGGEFSAQVKTAGSISLLLQVALPCALFAKAPSKLTLRGGTNAEMAPQVDYTTEVFRPILEKFGGSFDFELVRRGYFPKGGGEVVVNVNPVEKLNAVDITVQGTVQEIYGWSFAAGTLPLGMARRMGNSASSCLHKIAKNVRIECYKEDKTIAPDNCAGIILVAETDTHCFLGSSAIGNRDEQCEDTGKRAAEELIRVIKDEACVDDHCQDQIVIFMALAQGKSLVKVRDITMHTKTAIFIIEKLTNVKYEIIPSGSSNILQCTGAQ